MYEKERSEITGSLDVSCAVYSIHRSSLKTSHKQLYLKY